MVCFNSFMKNWLIGLWWGKWWLTIWKHPTARQPKIEILRSR